MIQLVIKCHKNIATKEIPNLSRFILRIFNFELLKKHYMVSLYFHKQTPISVMKT